MIPVGITPPIPVSYIYTTHGEYASLLYLPDNFIEVAHPVVHLPRVLISHHVLRDVQIVSMAGSR